VERAPPPAVFDVDLRSDATMSLAPVAKSVDTVLSPAIPFAVDARSGRAIHSKQSNFLPPPHLFETRPQNLLTRGETA
jgi:hypothetical protein